jgi:putative flavoprotein involved in K+ transport
MERLPVAVVGAGQAGLSVSHELSALGVEHTVLERGRVGQTWRDRWDSFCLVTPNWTVQLPGFHYDGPDPDGFMPRDEIVAYLERYAARAPVREGVGVETFEPGPDGTRIHTSAGELTADAVVLANGAYQRPHRPAAADSLPDELPQLDVADYRNPDALPPGRVLVVGSGQSGCQITEELHAAGRDVVLACGRAPWAPRRIGDRDLLWWAVESGFYDGTVESLPSPQERFTANATVTGHGGGRDLNLRTLHAAGVPLAGHLAGVEDGDACFAGDLAEIVSWGDERYELFAGVVRRFAEEQSLEQPVLEAPPPFDEPGLERVDLRDFGCVLFATGFRPDYASWLPPEAFDELGFPLHEEGESTFVPGLYFVGVHYLRKRKSSLFVGVGEDAAIVAGRVAERLGD